MLKDSRPRSFAVNTPCYDFGNMSAPRSYDFVEGPEWANDLARVNPRPTAMDTLMFAIQDLLCSKNWEDVSHSLGPDTDVRYIRAKEFFPNMPALYVTFRFETAEKIELRRALTAEDLRAGFYV